MKLRHLRPARSGPGRGTILALPNIHGTDADVGPLARHALGGHEIVSASLDLNGARIADSHVWLDFARGVADGVVGGTIPAPAAFMGFSVGGYLGWLIDRMLVARGAAPTPVVNLDGGALHLHWKSWGGAIAPLLPVWAQLAAARMLLLHSARPGALLLFDSSHADWQRLGVPVASLPCRSVNHPDFHGRTVAAASAAEVDSFIMAGGLAMPAPGRELDVATSGGQLFSALVSLEPPHAEAVRSLAETAISVNANVLSSLLFLAAATGDADLALDVAGRAMRIAPRFRPAAYAAAAVLREVGRADDAADLARSRGLGDSSALVPWRPWGSLTGVAIGSDASLDFAAAFCRR